MTIVVGIAPGKRGKSAVNLAGMIARSMRQELLLCSVTAGPSRPSGLPEIDTLYDAAIERQAEKSLTAARTLVPPDLVATTRTVYARSAPTGLLEVARETGAALIVLGSSSAGAVGRIALGGSTTRLLHSSPVPVALAPRRYRAPVGALTTRLTAAYAGSLEEDALLVGAAGLAHRAGVPLRVASWVVHPRSGIEVTVETTGGGTLEDPVITRWTDRLRSRAEEAASGLRSLPTAPHAVETAVGAGRSWAEVLRDVDWADGDVLLVGSSTSGAVARVFLGSRAAKIVRHSPVPVVVIPGRRAEELADQAIGASTPALAASLHS